MDAFTNESHKTKSSKDIDHDKIAALEARVRAIKEVDFYDHVPTINTCLILNMIVPKKFQSTRDFCNN
jgi:hypothetical protein